MGTWLHQERRLTLNERSDALMVLQCLLLLDKIDLVLQDYDIFELHDLDRGQVFTRLWLWARLVTRDQKKGCVHDRGTVEHRGHQDVVTWTIDEGDMTDKLHAGVAAWTFTGWIVLLV